MGTIMMDPGDLVTFAKLTGIPEKNMTAICVMIGKVNSGGIFGHRNPFSYPLPVTLLQFSLASSAILLTSLILKPLRLTITVRQILGGILLGPSFLGRSQTFTTSVFPLTGFLSLDAIASFGYIFYFFLIGVHMDPWIIKRIDRKACAIGFFSLATAMLLSTALCFFILHFFNVNQEIAMSLPVVAQAESAFAFPMIAQFLAELKIMNSEFGKLAISSSVISGLCSFCVITASVLLHQPAGDNEKGLKIIVNTIVIGIIIFLVIRHVIMRMIENNPPGEPLTESQIILLFLAVMITSFLSEALALHPYFGPLLLGIAIPAGPPVGSIMVERLHLIVNWILMPVFFAKNGLIINFFGVDFKNFLVVQSVALAGAFGKFLGAFLVALGYNMPLKDAASLGLVVNVQGVVELGMFKMMMNNKLIDSKTFVIMCASLLLVVGIITPIIRHLYDPSRKYIVYDRRTVMNLRANSELRVLVSIHEQSSVPTVINLLEALNPTRKSHLIVYVIHLIELVGLANPLLIAHRMTKKSSTKAKTSEHVIKAFRDFESCNNGVVAVFPYTAISPCKTMHDDVCTIALDNRTSLVIVPFYKKFLDNGEVDSINRSNRTTNRNVLDKAPCSVAILVDHRFLNTSRPVLYGGYSYRAAIMFLGGPDDREALAIGARMAGHENINLTVIRLLEKGDVSSNDISESTLDNEYVSKFRTAMAGNSRVLYTEEVVIDGSGTVSVIRSMENRYDLVMVGRHHDHTSPLLSGLVDWNNYKELGTIGDLLASVDFMGNTSILVVQQHTVNGVRMNSRKYFKNGNLLDDDEESIGIER